LDENEQSMFVTLFYGVLDPGTGEFVYANGGHMAPFLVSREGCDAVPRVSGIALGAVRGQSYVEGRIRLQPGDTLFLYTDGITECFDASACPFGAERLAHTLRGSRGSDPRVLVASVMSSLQEFSREAPQSDDIACLALRYGGG
jgi:sigma-B regulation protein RsbU (phosphoserine phosphatase)